MEGAQAPSSPFPQAFPRPFRRALIALCTAAFAYTASFGPDAPVGTIRNSWISVAFSACAPPPITLPRGRGREGTNTPPRYSYNSRPSDDAAAFALASETATAIFAPSAEKSPVPSTSRRMPSIATWSRESCPMRAGIRFLSANSIADPGSFTFASYSPGTGAARGCSSAKPGLGIHVSLYGGITPAVQYCPQVDLADDSHVISTSSLP